MDVYGWWWWWAARVFWVGVGPSAAAGEVRAGGGAVPRRAVVAVRVTWTRGVARASGGCRALASPRGGRGRVVPGAAVLCCACASGARPPLCRVAVTAR
ncbi:hypothetical protein PR202_gb02850 [Eleusine coracana subsp. coracana]|uniref:Secreted protein n=1 Tax=Eleusine coracana subsp. coracana TaxID=191504 RepID=A0AAV5E0F9_ELECO|nr:hypothetical protein PR202_gb02850 [Eleusine coracana subsp. coracana]